MKKYRSKYWKVAFILLFLCLVSISAERVSACDNPDHINEPEMNIEAYSSSFYGPNLDAPAAGEDAVLVPTRDNKKGIHGTEYRDDPKFADPDYMELGINHVVMNLYLDDFMNPNTPHTENNRYIYNGKEFYFNFDTYLQYYQLRIRELRQEGVAVTLILLMSNNFDPGISNLIYPGALDGTGGHYFYALNVFDPTANEQLNAAFDCLTRVLGKEDTFVQNWIVGNEVNMPREYNYTGTTDINVNTDLAATSFNMIYDALQRNNPCAKAYISYTCYWNHTDEGRGISTRAFLDRVVWKLGGREWNVAFHAYMPLFNYNMWDPMGRDWLSFEDDSQFVCAANLSVLTDYIKNNYGSEHRVLLSEQAFDANNGNAQQAAATAYLYYAAVRDDMVDGVMYTRWDDTENAVFNGSRLGFVDNDNNRRESYYVFKYMDTDQASQYVDKYLATIGIYQWDDIIIYGQNRLEPFKDVSDADWFYQSVVGNYKMKTMTGLTRTTFGPAQSISREQFVIILYRLENSPEVDYTGRFADVSSRQWYTDAVLWASEHSIVNGYQDGSGKFGVGDAITREQIAIMLRNYEKYKEHDVSASQDISEFTDADKVSDYALDAVQWAVATGMLQGKSNKSLDPRGPASRADTAAIMKRYLDIRDYV